MKRKASYSFYYTRTNHPISQGSRLLNAKEYLEPPGFRCRKGACFCTLRYASLAFKARDVLELDLQQKQPTVALC